MLVRLAVLTSLLLLSSCGDGGSPDAGMDSGGPADAGPADAGPADAGPTDAGPTDAGDAGPPTMVALATQVGDDLMAVTTAVNAVPMDMRLDGAFVEVDVASSGIDALIGEEGLMTLSLSDATVRAFADLRLANTLLEILDRAIAALAGRAEATAVHTAALDLQASLAVYRDSLATLFRARVDAGIVGTPVVVPMMFINLETSVTGAPARLAAVVEGADVSTETAGVSVLCFGSMPITITRLEVVNEETGVSLGTSSGSDSAMVTVAAPFDDVTPIAIYVETVPATPSPFDDCGVSVTTRRRLRADPVAISLGNAAYFTALSDYRTALDGYAPEALGLPEVGTVDATAVAAATEGVMLIADLIAPYLPSDMLPIPVETYRRIERSAIYVRAMIDAILASPTLAPTDADALRTRISEVMAAAEAIIVAVSPP